MARYSPLVEALLSPRAYPEEVGAVQLVETHISYIFLTGRHAYKVKKPVDYGFLDFTSLEKRRYYCHREVDLNRRISPAVYLGVSEVRLHQGRYAMDGPGETVEYAVKMRQMPQERAMSALLQQGRLSGEEVRRLAARIALFHREARSDPEITRLGGLETVRRNVEENFAQIGKFVRVALSQESFDDLHAYSRAFLAAREGAFTRRAAEGRIRDCHGDLHAAQVYFEDGITFLDCIEFNDLFRYSDVAQDVAFLAMDLDFHGRPDLSRHFVDAYVEASGDPGVLELLDFFKAYRACVRGKVTSFRLDDPLVEAAERRRMAALAGAYFRLARSYTRVLRQPALLLITGLMGTGKSTIAHELARRWDLAYISSDVTRKRLAGVAAGAPQHLPYGEGIYSPDFTRRTYDAMLKEAERRLRAGGSTVLDATFHRAEDRAGAVAMARRAGAEAWLVECSLPEGEVRRRLEQRSRKGGSVSDGRWELYYQQRGRWQPVKEVPSQRYLCLDTSGTPGESVRRLLYELYKRTLSGYSVTPVRAP